MASPGAEATVAATTTARLETWLADRLHGRDQAVPYHLSPDWGALMATIYDDYDVLEARRQHENTPRLPWQDAVERERRFTDAELARPPSSPSDDEWPLAPLAVHLSRYLGRPDPDPERRLWGWAAAVADWAELRNLYHSDTSFAASLSRPQAASLALLEAWWTAAYCDPSLPAAAKSFIDARVAVETRDDPLEARKASGPETMTDASLYHSSCFGLFLSEMHPRTWYPHVPSSVKNLQIVRRLTASQCLLQRIAYTAIARNPSDTSPPYPGRIDWSAAPTALDSADLAVGPYHLWDTQERRTITVSDLPSRPPYLCVSHTWGRWRTRTDAPVPGVPWPVPENKLYDVRSLPDKLPRLGSRYVWLDLFCIPQDRGERARLEIANQASIFRGATHCVAWLHDVESWHGVRAALEWLGLRYLLATSTRDANLIKASLADAVAAASVRAELISRIEGHDGSTGDVAGVEPCTWFSSLWTLQECALCPDLELCSRTWELLTDRWGAPVPLRSLMDFANDVKLYLWNEAPADVPLSDDLAYRRALMARPAPDFGAGRNDPSYPPAVRDLLDVQGITGLDNALSTASPMAVLVNANLRQCSSRNRAPAVMSALGVTGWYRDNLAAGLEPSVFVHDMYPLEFLREAAAALGAPFYDTMSRVPPRRRPVRPLLAIWLRRLCEGTMLPVARDPGWGGRVTMSPSLSSVVREDHPSVATWIINGDGSVSVRQAGVVMTSRDTPEASGPPKRAWVDCATAMEVDHPPFYFSFQDNVDDMLDLLKVLTLWWRRLYAVALYKSGETVHGVILEEIAWGAWDRRYLTKIGRFSISRGEMPPVSDVNWEIM
ncbi:hypothetical protein B0T11DRAFT_327057 [Plectosphaerella cucumerina]|uniref:Heterokaryon incompatibility domain-containing protein n=1 Tax=Plectosphaerella cucumerina TaxID=40658 RepID=A0A8K0TNN1_9PEZI|nr:hypothetical protein B0T11DRAFT_327057 [Plectosphaerella cucumerina]